jgi:inner membrane protein
LSPITHFLVSWALAGTSRVGKRERAAIALAGVAPDLDGLGIVPELLTRGSSHPLLWFSDYHHVLGHNVIFAVIVTLAGFLSALAAMENGGPGVRELSFAPPVRCDWCARA